MLKPAFIDLSHHNVVPQSLMPARQSGIVGVIHKLTEGIGFVDSKVYSRFFLAEEANLCWGLYHFVRPGDISAQARFFLDQSIEVSNDNTLFCLDWEDSGVSKYDALDFLEYVEDGTGHSPVIYSGHVLKEALNGKPDEKLSKYRLWLAQYASEPDLPPGWEAYWGWQYTEDGDCPGIQSPVDLNAYLGTATDLRADWSGYGKQPIPEPEPGSEVVIDLKINAPDNVKVVVRINGETVE